MTAQRQTNWTYLRILFIFLEVALVVSGVWFALIQVFADPRMHIIGATEDIVGGVYMTAMLTLLFGSPWFIKSLRWVALVGWALAFLALLSCLLIPALR